MNHFERFPDPSPPAPRVPSAKTKFQAARAVLALALTRGNEAIEDELKRLAYRLEADAKKLCAEG